MTNNFFIELPSYDLTGTYDNIGLALLCIALLPLCAGIILYTSRYIPEFGGKVVEPTDKNHGPDMRINLVEASSGFYICDDYSLSNNLCMERFIRREEMSELRTFITLNGELRKGKFVGFQRPKQIKLQTHSLVLNDIKITAYSNSNYKSQIYYNPAYTTVVFS